MVEIYWKQAYEDVIAENHKLCETLDKLRRELLIAIEKVVELDAKLAKKDEEIAALTEKYLRAGAIAEGLRDDNTILEHEIAENIKLCQTIDKLRRELVKVKYLTAEGINESDNELRELFKSLRFDENHHLGLGDVRLTIGQQDEIVAIHETALKKRDRELVRLKGKYPPIPDDFVEDKP